MSAPRPTTAAMTVEQFLAWAEGRDGRFELLDGEAVAMRVTGAAERAVHVRTKYALTKALERAIAEAGLPCEAFVDGMAVRIDERTLFEPDALVRCGDPLAGDAVLVRDPVIVVEVASPSTQRIDALLKLTRYFDNPAVAHYLIAMPAEGSVVHHRRGADGGIGTAIARGGRLALDPPGMVLDLDGLLARGAAGPPGQA